MKELRKRVILPYEPIGPFHYDLPSQYAVNAALATDEIATGAWEYLFQNYTTLHCLSFDRDLRNKGIIYKNIHIGYPYNPYISRTFGYLSYENPEKVLNTVINHINNNQYVKIRLDAMYLPGYMYYNRNHNYHQEMVYGYDLERQIIYLFGHTKLALGALEKKEVSFENFKNAVQGAITLKTYFSLTYDRINTDAVFNFELRKTYQGLSDYYESKCSFYAWFTSQWGKNPLYWEERVGHVYGINVVLEIYKMVSYLIENEIDADAIINKIKYFQALCDYSELMVKRVKYINNAFFKHYLPSIYNSDSIVEQSDLIWKNYLAIRNLILRSFVDFENDKSKITLNIVKKLLLENYFLEKDFGNKFLYNIGVCI